MFLRCFTQTDHPGCNFPPIYTFWINVVDNCCCCCLLFFCASVVLCLLWWSYDSFHICCFSFVKRLFSCACWCHAVFVVFTFWLFVYFLFLFLYEFVWIWVCYFCRLPYRNVYIYLLNTNQWNMFVYQIFKESIHNRFLFFKPRKKPAKGIVFGSLF